MPRSCCILIITSGSLLTLLLVTSTRPVAALVGTLTPVNRITEVGSDVVLNCTLYASSNEGRTTQDVIWKHSSVQLPLDMYTSLNDTVSQLTLTNVTFNDSGNYWCLFPRDDLLHSLGSLVRVGIQPEPPLVECFIRNPDEYWCKWEQATETNLRITHTFAFLFSGIWTDCPDTPSKEVKGPDTCFIPISHNTGTRQTVRVTSSNALGNANTVESFDPSIDVVVNPPEDVSLRKLDTETSLSVMWSIPKEWPRIYILLDYKIRFKTSDCFIANDTHCSWTVITIPKAGFPLERTLRDLAPYTAYGVQMTARYRNDEKNWSEWTETKSLVTRETLPTAKVQDIKVNLAGESVYYRNMIIFWQGVPQDQLNGELLCYEIQVTSLGQTCQVTPPVNTCNCSKTIWYKVEGLKKFQGYDIRIAAKNGAGVGPWESEQISDLTTAPNAPDKVRAVAMTTTSIFVSWDEPSQPNGYIATYTIEWGKANGQKDSYTTRNGTNHTIVDLKKFALYEISVKATNSRGSSGGYRSVPGGVRTLEGVPSAAPTNVEVEAIPNQPNRLTVLWQRPPAEHINGNLTGYRISYCESRLCAGDLNKQNLSRPDAVSYTLTDLAPSTLYRVWIAAHTTVGMGPNSQPLQAKTTQETQGILIMAIVVPILIVTISTTLACFLWKRCRYVFQPLPEPKFHKEVDLFKNNSQRLSRSSSRMEEEHFDEILPSPNDANIIDLLGDKIELAKEASQMCPKLDLILESVSLDSKAQTARFFRSHSRDSGVPPSPDLCIMRDILSSNEEGDDNVFLEDEGNPVSPSSPTETVGAYTMVGQFIPSNKQTPKTSQSSPVKSPKKVSFDISSVNKVLPTSPNHKQSASQDKQNVPRKSIRSSSSSSMDVSPYTQMSALESLQRVSLHANVPNLLQTQSTARTGVKIPSSSPSVVSPYTQMSALASHPHQQQQNRPASAQPQPQSPAGIPVSPSPHPLVAPYTQMSAMASLQPTKQQKSGEAKKPSPGSPDKSRHTPESLFSNPYTQMPVIASLKPKSCQSPNPRQQEANQPRQETRGSTNSPPISPYTTASSILELSNPMSQKTHQQRPLQPTSDSPTVSPYTQVSLLKLTIPRQQEADQPRPEPPSSSPSFQAVSPYTKALILEQQEADQPNSQPSNGSPNSLLPVSPYTQVSPFKPPNNAREQGSHQPRSQSSESQTFSSKANMQEAKTSNTNMSELGEKPKQNKSISSLISTAPEPILPRDISPYTKLSDKEAMQPGQDQSLILSSQPVPPRAVSPYTKMSDMVAMQPRQDKSLHPNHIPVSAVSSYTKISQMAAGHPLSVTSCIENSEVDARLESKRDQRSSRESSPLDVQQSWQPCLSDATNIDASGYSTGAPVPQNILPPEPGTFSQSKQGQVKSSKNPQIPPKQTSPGYLLTNGSSEGYYRMQDSATSPGLPPHSQAYLGSDSDDELDDYSQMSASVTNRAGLGSGSDQAGNAADQASNLEVSPYTLMSRNEEFQSSSAPPQDNVPSIPFTDNTTEDVPGYVAHTHNNPQSGQSNNVSLNFQDGPSEISSIVADYSLVAAVGSSTDQAAVRDMPSPAYIRSDISSDDSGFDNETDSQGNDTPSHSLLSDYVQVGAALSQVHNTHPHPTPTGNLDISNHLVVAASDAQPVADYVLTASVSSQSTNSQV